MEVYKLDESKEEVTVLVSVRSSEEASRADPGVRAAKRFESRKRREVSTLNGLL